MRKYGCLAVLILLLICVGGGIWSANADQSHSWDITVETAETINLAGLDAGSGNSWLLFRVRANNTDTDTGYLREGQFKLIIDGQVVSPHEQAIDAAEKSLGVNGFGGRGFSSNTDVKSGEATRGILVFKSPNSGQQYSLALRENKSSDKNQITPVAISTMVAKALAPTPVPPVPTATVGVATATVLSSSPTSMVPEPVATFIPSPISTVPPPLPTLTAVGVLPSSTISPTQTVSPTLAVAQEWIPGLTVAEVIQHLGTRNIRCGSSQTSNVAMFWRCESTEGSLKYLVTIWSKKKNQANISSIEAVISHPSSPVSDADASMFFTFLAALPYQGAESEAAKKWIVAEIASTHQQTFGGASFVLGGPGTRVRGLDIRALLAP